MKDAMGRLASVVEEEKKKLEGELEAMGQCEDFELIDENKKAYDEVVEELKKLESEQFAPFIEARTRSLSV